MEHGKELAESCMQYALELGADYADARFVTTTIEGHVYRNGAPVSGGRTPSAGIGMRVLVEGSMGFASIDRLDRGLARSAVETAVKMARTTRRREPVDMGGPVSNRASWSMDVRDSLRGVDIDTIAGLAGEMNRQMEGLPSYTLILSPVVCDKYLVTSEGTEVTGHTEQLQTYVLLTGHGKAGSEQRFMDLTTAGGWERVKDTGLVERVADEVQRFKRVLEVAVAPKELVQQPVDMVVGPEVAGIIAHENVGHPSEGDRIMGREGAQAGESFWRDLKIGEARVGSQQVTVCEDPTIPNTGGFYLYDDEGVRARRRFLIKEGVANEPLLNREFGARFGTGSNGAARAAGFDREPIIRMSNTFFAAGDHTFEELFEGISLGVYMRSFSEWNIDDRRYQSKYTGCEAYLIRDGALTDTLVKRPILESTSVGLLSAVDAVSKDEVLDFAATCGKGDPMQPVPVYAGGGHVRIRGIRLGGVG